MENKNQKHPWQKSFNKAWLVFPALFLILIAAVGGFVFRFEKTYAQKIYPGVKIAGLDLTGQTKTEALNRLKKVEEDLQNQGLNFKAQDQTVTVSPIIISETDPDFNKNILSFDWPKMVDNAYQIGRQGNLGQKFADQLSAYYRGRMIAVIFDLNREEVIKTLQDKFSAFEKQPLNPQITVQDGRIEILPEQAGYVFDYNQAVEKLVNQIRNLNFATINLELIDTQATISLAEVENLSAEIEPALKVSSLTLKGEGQKWTLRQAEFFSWLEFKREAEKIIVVLSQEKTFDFLRTIGSQIDVSAKDAKFDMVDGKVKIVQNGQDGKALNLEENYKKINEQILAGNSADLDLLIETTYAKVISGDLNELGVKELIGRGTSNFAGSPKNRRINIAVGAASLNGILIKPGEEFSLIKALGPIDGEHGYKQELVIKGDRTVPEYGGGLCQIGTTAFRAALYSGLPITQRRNHSYRVVYYEPAGMDATIYDPAPDLKFINDTNAHVLFTTRIKGDNLIFEFYGTDDGRKIEISPDPPKIYNITKPGAPKYIETEELKPGEKKQLEKPHNGADTYFKYTVTYPSGEVKEKEFSSHYVAWPEVWLVGKEVTASSTAETSAETAPAETTN